jgi:putative DNA primase/helicase
MSDMKEEIVSDFAKKVEEKVKGIRGKYRILPSPLIYPELDDNRVLDTFENLKCLLGHFNAEIKYNLMSRRREIIIPGHELFLDDIDNSALDKVHYLATLNFMPTNRLDNHLNVLAYKNTYHPVVKFLSENSWDGVHRLHKFISSIKTENDELSHALIKRWMIAAIAAAHSVTGFINQGVLVIQGAQGIGKTMWVKSLDPIGCNAVKEGAILDPANKDSVILLARHWIVELGELDATFNKSDIARLKSFITMESDDVRFPYAAKSSRLPRRTAYIATVNDEKFLSDDTGNRRWWTITAKEIDLNHGLDMGQVWAEVYNLWVSGSLPYLSKDEQLQVNKENLEHEKIDPLREKLLDSYNWTSDLRRYLPATKVLEELGFNKPNRSEATKMGNLLKEFTKNNSKMKDGYRLYAVPNLSKPFPSYLP